MTDPKAQLDRAIEALQPVKAIFCPQPTSASSSDVFERGCPLTPSQIRKMQEALAIIESPEVKGCGRMFRKETTWICNGDIMLSNRHPNEFKKGKQILCLDCHPKPETVTDKHLVVPTMVGFTVDDVNLLWDHVAELTKRLNDMEAGK